MKLEFGPHFEHCYRPLGGICARIIAPAQQLEVSSVPPGSAAKGHKGLRERASLFLLPVNAGSFGKGTLQNFGHTLWRGRTATAADRWRNLL